ncbi:MAG: RNA polymerase sigma factor [Anaerolineae bacterium]|nr:RNA polymerase sigma factor [Anaerolineae bacterium]
MTGNVQRYTLPYPWEKNDVTADGIDDLSDFSSIYNRHSLAIYRYILARIGHVEDAQDLAAQVFLKAYRNAASYRGESSVIGWLMGIARHQIIDYYRDRRVNVSLASAREIPNPAPPPDVSLEQKERLKRVFEALNALSEDRREALSLRLFAGLTNREIAGVMDKSVSAVAMLVHRGIQDLRTRLGEEDI